VGHLPIVPPATDVAFFAVFGVFVVAFVILVAITLRWAVRRDRAGKAAWRERRAEAAAASQSGGGGGKPPGSRRGAADARRGGQRRSR